MKKRILYLGLLAVVTQLFGTGCYLFRPVARWRANHPCGACSYHPRLHPIQTRRAVISEGSGPVLGYPFCGSCGPSTPVSFGGYPGEGMPGGVPTIGYPQPITPGPTVIPNNELPSPMPAPKNNGN